MRALVSIIAVTSFAACTAEDPEDGENDSFTDEGKADAVGAVEGTPEALGALLVANRSTKDELVDAGVSASAASHIVAHRPVATLVDLDDIPYVGPTAWKKLKDEATERGWTTPEFYVQRQYVSPEYKLIPRRDGTLTTLVKEGTYWKLITDYGTGLQKSMKFDRDLSRVWQWTEDRSGTLYALLAHEGTDAMSVISIKPADVAPNSENNPVKTLTIRRGFWSIVVDDDTGLIHVVENGDISAPGMFTRTCTADTCAQETQALSPTPRVTSRQATATYYKGEIYIAIVESKEVQLFRGKPGAWTREDFTLAARNIDPPKFLTGDGTLGLRFLVAPAVGWQPALEVYTRDSTWTSVPLPASLYADQFDVALVHGHGLVVKAVRNLERKWPTAGQKYARFARLLDQKDGFKGQVLSPQNWQTSILLPTGEVLAVDKEEYSLYSTAIRTRGAPVKWRDDDVGAGSLEYDRDPCWFSPRPSTNPWPDTTLDGEDTVVTIAAGTTLTIAAGSCVHVDRIIGDGELVIAGTAAQPVHMIGTRLDVDRVRASYVFFDDTPYKTTAPLGTSDDNFGMNGELDHVSAAWETKGTLHRTWIPSDGWLAQRSLWVNNALPVAKRLVIRDSDFGPLDGDAIWLPPSTSLEVYDTTFHDLGGTAISVQNGGLDDTTLTLENVTITNVLAGVRVLTYPDDKRSQYLTDLSSDNPTARAAILARLGTVEAATTPIDIRNLKVHGTTVAEVPDPQPALLLQAPVGTIAGSTITGAGLDGVQIFGAGLFEINTSHVADNLRHGIYVTAAVPTGLGPCAQASQGPITLVVRTAPDPLVLDSVIENNGGSGLFVSGPHIPMTVQRNNITGNALAGFVIDAGRGISGRRQDASCPGGYRYEAEVDVPLAPETTINDNNFVDNGSAEDGVQLRSDHRLSTLPVTNNYWGVTASLAVSKLRCTGTCAWDPARSTARP